MKIKILNEYGYQSFPIVDGMVEVNEEDLIIINKEEKTPEEIKLINTFNDFYIRKPRKAED